MNIHHLGFDQWFEAQSADLNVENCAFARIAAVDRGAYRIKDAAREIPAELSGKLLFQSDSAADLPCVGDWVAARYYDDDAAAIIHHVFLRKTFLRRKAPGESIGFQMIAANIDTVFIVQSCHFDFNPSRLERYLVMAADGGVAPVIVLTKTDLITPEALDRQLASISLVTKAKVIALSNITGIGFDAFYETLSSGKTYCLVGSSGVGKTTLVNRLIGRESFATQSVSGTGEGAHTTTRRQLTVLDQGAMLIDTPGMRELGIMDAHDGIDAGFEEFSTLALQCRYANCSHEHEPGCAVRAAIEKGELDEDRYSNYKKLKKESAYYGMSYLDKRKKDKAFGRFIKSVKKRMKS